LQEKYFTTGLINLLSSYTPPHSALSYNLKLNENLFEIEIETVGIDDMQANVTGDIITITGKYIDIALNFETLYSTRDFGEFKEVIKVNETYVYCEKVNINGMFSFIFKKDNV